MKTRSRQLLCVAQLVGFLWASQVSAEVRARFDLDMRAGAVSEQLVDGAGPHLGEKRRIQCDD